MQALLQRKELSGFNPPYSDIQPEMLNQTIKIRTSIENISDHHTTPLQLALQESPI
ncbi:MAG: hypothetical protein QOK81_04560 [Nitrososphaeraceae archaeon]|nr:hypothetical protein [Nitrososphaeraceae archaeon]